jgi:Tfp pilus assembly protein PilN
MLRPLTLNFHRDAASARLLRFALLGLGVLAAVACVVRFQGLRKEANIWEAKLEDMSQIANRKVSSLGFPARDGKLPVEEVKRANIVLEHMAVPWGMLFSELEATSDEGLALLAIQPDASSRQVRIAGVASNLRAVTAFVTRLEAQPHLTGVHLVEHALRPGSAAKPVSFSILASWVDGS